MNTLARGHRWAARGERGSGSLLWGLALALAGLLGLAALAACAAQVELHRVQGAADLVAIAGAQARNTGLGEPCAAAGRQAQASRVRLARCDTVGDQLSFAVTVEVEAEAGGASVLRGWSVRSRANAGVRPPTAPGFRDTP